jgi:hypothetical protein
VISFDWAFAVSRYCLEFALGQGFARVMLNLIATWLAPLVLINRRRM